MDINSSLFIRGGKMGVFTETTSWSSLHNYGYYSVENTTYIDPCAQQTSKDKYTDFYEAAQFVTGLIIYPIVCTVGIIGNILTLIVLHHKDMATSTNVYLAALAVSDSFKLLNDLMYFVVLLIKRNGGDASNLIMSHLYPYAHYIFSMSVSVTAWLTVSVALERYIAVCHPTKAKEMCTITKARIVSTVVFITVILLSLPTALRYEAVLKVNRNNVTCYNPEASSLGQNETFMTPYTWIQNSLRSLIPLVVLIFVNTKIINALRKQRVKGKKFSARNRITLMLIVIILVFVVCIIPDAIMSTFFGFGYIDGSDLVKGVREISDTLLALNSGFNFALYCTMSQVFRETFVKIFCSKFLKPDQVEERLLSNGKPIVRREKGLANNNQETYV